MSISTRNIETLAVSHVSTILASCPHLSPGIDKNDRTPFTDGHIDLHDATKDHSKSTFRGRVAAQVKGRALGSKRRKRSSYRLSRSDLEGYLKLRGVLLFVVTIHTPSNRYEIDYAILSSFTIRDYLTDLTPRQATTAVKLRPLPNDVGEIERIVSMTNLKQNEAAYLTVDLAHIGEISNFTLHTTADVQLGKPVRLDRREVDYIFECTTEAGLRIPLAGEVELIPSDFFEHDLGATFISGGVEYRDATRKLISTKEVQIRISDGLSIKLSGVSPRDEWTLTITMREKLSHRLSDLRFLFGMIDSCAISINGAIVPVRFGSTSGFEGLRAHLDELSKIEQLFDALGAPCGYFNLIELDTKLMRQLHLIWEAIVNRAPVKLEIESPGRIFQPLGQWGIELISQNAEEDGEWMLLDPLDPHSEQQWIYRESNETESPYTRVTYYEVLDEGYFPRILNLHLDNVVATYDNLRELETTSGFATQTLMRLLRGVDKVPERREEFLLASEELGEWLMKTDQANPANRINSWQTTLRRRALTGAELDDIRQLKRESSRSSSEKALQVEVCCAILLGDRNEVDFLKAQMAGQSREELTSWPIWDLHARSCHPRPDSALPELPNGSTEAPE